MSEWKDRFDNVVGLAGGWDQAARICERSVQQLKRYAKGDDVPFGVLSKLANTAGVSLDWLATGTGGIQQPAEPARRGRYIPQADMAEPNTALLRRAVMRLPIAPGKTAEIYTDQDMTEKELEALLAQLNLQLQVMKNNF